MPAADLALMREMDELYLTEPTWGTRKLVQYFCTLQPLQPAVNRKRIQRLRSIMGLATIYRGPRTSLPGPKPQIFPYLLRGLKIDGPDHVWCSDITYVPMPHGYLYLTAVMDWFSRKVLSWEISNTLGTDFCLTALAAAVEYTGVVPLIFNTDQGAQYTSLAWIAALQTHGTRVSHDGRGRWMDNVFIERLWRTIKHDDIYLKCYPDGKSLYFGIKDFIRRYNETRPHDALGGLTPSKYHASYSSCGMVPQRK